MPIASNGDVDVYYEVDGPTDAPTVALVEGLGFGRWMWDWQREALAERYETVVVDNRGTGRSDAPEGPYSIAEMAGDLDAVLAAEGAERAHLVGASMGGMIVQRYAIDRDRAASVALLCTSPGGEDAVETPPDVRARMVEAPAGYDEREVLRHRMAPAMTDAFREEREEVVDRIIDRRLEQDAGETARRAQLAAVGEFDVSDRLDEIEVPALVAHGTADRVVPVENAELLVERLPDARPELFEGGPHLFFIEEADAVSETLVEFVGAREDENARSERGSQT